MNSRPALSSLVSLSAIIQDYVSNFRDPAKRELQYFKIQRTLPDAIREAALSRLPSGKRHPHQRRIPGAILLAAEHRLQHADKRLLAAKDFDELFNIVQDEIGGIRGIGELAVYDIAHRIGAFLQKEPEIVYVHAGVREGAKALGIAGNRIMRSQLPRELQVLPAAQVEDILCIYKRHFKGLARFSPRSKCYG